MAEAGILPGPQCHSAERSLDVLITTWYAVCCFIPILVPRVSWEQRLLFQIYAALACLLFIRQPLIQTNRRLTSHGCRGLIWPSLYGLNLSVATQLPLFISPSGAAVYHAAPWQTSGSWGASLCSHSSPIIRHGPQVKKEHSSKRNQKVVLGIFLSFNGILTHANPKLWHW